MTSLVAADYGNSSSDENPDSEDEQIISENKSHVLTESEESDLDSDCNESDNEVAAKGGDVKAKKLNMAQGLPSASSIFSTNSASAGQVFNNPYKLAETAQIASLEKHVKMVDNEIHTQTKNGKKVCWNYRKGRCRFGSNCTYAHDSDLHTMNDKSSTKSDNTKPNATSNVQNQITEQKSTHGNNRNNSNKKRPGLSNSIVPSKKVIKNYNTLKKSLK